MGQTTRIRVIASLGVAVGLASAGGALVAGCAAGGGAEKTRVRGFEPYRVNGTRYVPLRDWEDYREEGIASWYGGRHHGRLTASGERFDAHGALTAAHKTLPFDACASVENLRNGRRVVVRINDRGPFAKGRIIDLSRAAAAEIGLLRSGVTRVRVEAVGAANAKGNCHKS